MQKQLKVSIRGKQYVLFTDEHEQDILQAARLVDSLMDDKSAKMPNVTDDKVALVVALHLATDLTKSKRLLDTEEVRLGALLQLLDDVV